jgi:photosystem II stability/assembly factor-like uncharacterized protein
MSIKKFVIFSFGLFVLQSAKAQKLTTVLPKTASTFAEITHFADSFFASTGANLHLNEHGVAAENDYLKYKRWQYYWKNRIMPDGSWPDAMQRFEIYRDLNKQTRGGQWENFSQTTSQSGYNGMGRVLSVAFHPTDSNIMYVTAPKGGVWKTVDGGNSWTAKGDALPTLFTGKVVCDPLNGNTLYLSLGDDTYWVYDDPSLGIYKSTDGGDTWVPTGQTYMHSNNVRINDLAMLNNNSQVIASAQSNGLFVSTDAGATWTQKVTGNFKQVIAKPFSTSTLYAAKYESNSMKFYTSVDGGSTWNTIYAFPHNTSKISMATTVADSNFIAAIVVSDSAHLYTSNNAGATFTKKGAFDDADYLGVSAYNKNNLYIGGVSSYKSSNGGLSFNKLTHWYADGVHAPVHADAHYYASSPITKKLFYCNDGGMYRYNEQTDVWKDLSDGLIITQFYKCAVSQLDSTYYQGGTQDNGGRILNNGMWSASNGGDAMEQATDIIDENVAFSTYVDGQLYRTVDRWLSDTEVTPDATDLGSWVTPYVVHPKIENVMVAGYSRVYKSTTNGIGWNPISPMLGGSDNSNLDCIAIARSDDATIYTSNSSKLYRTYDDGANWANVTVPDGNTITELYVHPKNSKIVYLSKSGYSAGKKVYKSVDGGVTFTNISFNLPNVPANTIIVDQESDSANVEQYVGTDVGVFYKKDLDAAWTYYNTGLPNTEVSDLEIQYKSGILVAATYGRGMWRTRINRPIVTSFPLSTTTVVDKTPKANILYANNQVILQIEDKANLNANFQITNINGQVLQTVNESASNGFIVLKTDNLPAGMYFVRLHNTNKALQFVVK